MNDDWVNNFIRNPPNLRHPEPKSHVDPQQLQNMLQEAFDKVSTRIGELEQTVAAQAQVQNLTLRAFVDFGIADYGAMLDALTQIEDAQNSDAGRSRVRDMKASLENSFGEGRPHLSLVPKPDQKD